MFLCSASLAVQAPADTQPQSPERKPDSAPSRSTPRSPGPVTAEELLRALQSTRPANEVILPASRAGRGPVSGDQTLLPEGTSIVDRAGQLVMGDSGCWEFKPDEGPSLPLLPNGQLESMAIMHKAARGDLPMVISAEVTVFGGKNYLLVKQMKRAAPAPASSSPRSPAKDGAVRSDASAQDVLQALEQQRPDQNPRQEEASIDQGSAAPQDAPLEGSLVVRRSGRLLSDGPRWLFRFDDKQAAGMGTITVLPNQALELMIQAVKSGGAGGLVFIVSGETTQFESESFLLVRGVTRTQDAGNLRP